MNTCDRCSTEIAEDRQNENRHGYEIWDSAESSGDFQKGKLCRDCWYQLRAFMDGESL